MFAQLSKNIYNNSIYIVYSILYNININKKILQSIINIYKNKQKGVNNGL